MLQFRGYALGYLGSFLLDVWVAHEPYWDWRHHSEVTPTPAFPARLNSFDAGVHWQQGAHVGPAATQFGGPWAYADLAERSAVGAELAHLLVDELLPETDGLLDRESVLERARHGQPLRRTLRPRDVVDCLIVSDGAVDEFVDVLTRRCDDVAFVAWAHDRRDNGPTWREGGSAP